MIRFTLSRLSLSGMLLFTLACTGAPSGDTPEPPKADETKADEAKADEAKADEAKADEEAVTVGVTPEPDDDYSGAYQEITMESEGDMMKWKLDAIEVTAGKRVRITIKNSGTSSNMKHNLLIVKKGSVQEVGIAAVRAGEAKQYIPDNANVLFASALTEPGGSVTLTFDPPEAGEYEFMCSYIGHFQTMNGPFVVKAAE